MNVEAKADDLSRPASDSPSLEQRIEYLEIRLTLVERMLLERIGAEVDAFLAAHPEAIKCAFEIAEMIGRAQAVGTSLDLKTAYDAVLSRAALN